MNAIQAENALPGTLDWKLTNPVSTPDRDSGRYRTRIIEGFASAPSVNKGEQLTFYVSTTAATFSLEIFRMGFYGGHGARRMPGASWSGVVGVDQPMPADESNDCHNWTPAALAGTTGGAFTIPLDWVSGAYVARLTEGNTGKQSYIFFVVRDDASTAPYIMQCSFTTYHAYNGWGGRSYYGYTSHNNATTLVSFNRPFMTSHSPRARHGNGAGQFFTTEKGPNDTGVDTSPYSVSGWEYNMVRWLESNGYDVTYCTNVDVHRAATVVTRHKAFLSVGHDEYWSQDARRNIELARDSGTSLAWFSGNTVWNVIQFENDLAGRPLRRMRLIGNYSNYDGRGIFWPEESLIGGTWVTGENIDMKLTPACPAWLSAGTGVGAGAALGDRIGGYEVNGLRGAEQGKRQYCPPGMKVVLATNPQGNGDVGEAILYTSRQSGSTVFSAGTVQWSWGLDDFTVEENPAGRGARRRHAVERLTKNVLAHMTDSLNMVADLPDGEYQIQSLSALPQRLLVANHGAPDGPVIIYGDSSWAGSNHQAVWLIKRYTGTSYPSAPGPYKAAEGRAWYTLRNKQNGQSLIVANNGLPDGPVIVIGNAMGSWGEPPDNTQKMWRIWRYGSGTCYLIQNVASGQLLIVANNGALDGPVVVHGDNGGWGELEDSPQKLWVFTRLG